MLLSPPLIFVTPENRPGKHDGDEFRAEALNFRKVHGGDVVNLVGPKIQRQRDWEKACADHAGKNVRCVAFFGHGVPNGLVALWGYQSLRRCSDSLALCLDKDGDVVLYACQAGAQSGFAEALADECKHWGFKGRIWGHTTAGHTTRNPYCTVYPRVTDGGWVIDPKSPMWPAWVKAMRTDYRYDFWTNKRPGQIAIDLRPSMLAGSRIIPERP